MENINIPIRKQKPKLITSIIAIGNPIIDITAEIEEDIVRRYNLNPGDINYATDENLGFYSAIEQMLQVSKTPGGSAQNILRAISWGLRSNQINNNLIKLSMLGSVGGDSYKNQIINSLNQYNIKTDLLEEISNMRTSRCAIGIFNGNKYFLSEILASKNLSKNFILQNWNKIISHDALIVEGYFLRENFLLCKNICEMFYESGKYIILTLSEPFIIERFMNEIIEIASLADMIVGNHKAAKKFVGEQTELKIGDLLKKVHQKINNRKIKDRILLVTVGNNGVFCSKFDSRTGNEINFQTYPEKVNAKDIVDSNGAGDAFLGGFISQQMQNKTFENCCEFGNKAAAVVIKNIGCIFPNIIIQN